MLRILGRILVVDDSPHVAATVGDMLDDAGYSVKTAFSGTEALRLIPIVQPDAMLLDLQLPDMPGSEVLAAVRIDHPGLPVIIVSGAGDSAVATRLVRRGAFDYVHKPFTRQRLVEVIEAAMGLLGRERRE